MKIKFENKFGSIVMSGGGSEDIRITSISGLSLPDIERRTFTSFDFDGAVESGRKLLPRSIVIGGDVRGGMEKARSLLRLLAVPSKMTISCNDFNRVISVSAAKGELDKKSRNYTKFAIALTCDDPYFYDAKETSVGLYVKENLLCSSTTLPAVFSRRTQGAVIVPSGDAEIEARYIISGKKLPDLTDGKIVISNLTTGKDFTLLYVPENDEIITIDMESRAITSNKSGNMMEYISDDSFLSDLVVSREGCSLFVVGYGAANDIRAYLVYRNKYIEAAV